MDKIMALARSANYDKDPFLKEFGIQVSAAMAEHRARVLDPPKVQYNPNNRRMNPVSTPKDGAWDRDLPGQVLLEPAHCRGYSLIALVPDREQGNLQSVFFL